MSEKTSAWTEEERAEMRRQKRADNRDAFEGRIWWPETDMPIDELDDGYDAYERGVRHGAAVLGGLIAWAWAVKGRGAYNPDCARCVALDHPHDPDCGWGC